MSSAKCPVCGAGPMSYKNFVKHYYANHFKSKKKKKEKKRKYWSKPKLHRRK